MRAIAHDLGQAMGCGAHLRDLRRLASGEFRIEQARTIEQLRELAAEGRMAEALVPAGEMLPDFPAVYVDDLVVNHIRQGRNFPVSPFRTQRGGRYVKAISRGGRTGGHRGGGAAQPVPSRRGVVTVGELNSRDVVAQSRPRGPCRACASRPGPET